MRTFSVASWNIHWGGLTPAGEPYDAITAARALDSDILVLQESWWPDGEEDDLHTALRGSGYQLIEQRLDRELRRGRHRFQTDHTGDWGVLVASRLPIRRIDTYFVGTVPGDPILDRCVAHLQVKIGSTPVDVIVPHLSAIPIVGPVTQLRRLARQLPALQRGLLVGDLNITPPVVRRVLGTDWQPAVGGFTWPARRPWCQIDHLLTTGDVAATNGVVCSAAGSDHHAIRADIAVR